MKLQQKVRLESPLSIDEHSISPSLIPDTESKPDRIDNFIRLTPKFATIVLALIVLLLTLSHLWAMYLESTFPEQSKLRRVVVQYFHFGNEGNFPTFFSAVLLLLSSIISFCLYKLDLVGAGKKNVRYWLTLSLILLFLSADEAVQIHEQLMSVTHYLIPNLSSILASAWVVPYALIALLVAFYFIRFVFRLPTKTRNLIIAAGFTFVLGALGLEIAETYLHSEYGVKHLLFTMNILVQELLEMTGVVLFVYALLDYLSRRHKGILVKLN